MSIWIKANRIPKGGIDMFYSRAIKWLASALMLFVVSIGVEAKMVKIPGGTLSGNKRGYGFWAGLYYNRANYDSLLDGVKALTVPTFYMEDAEVTFSTWQSVYAWAVKHGYSFRCHYYLKSQEAIHRKTGYECPCHKDSGMVYLNEQGGNYPVMVFELKDILLWCNARSEMEGLKPAYYEVVGEKRDDGIYPKLGGVARKYENDALHEFLPVVDLKADGFRLPLCEEWEYAALAGNGSDMYPWGNTISKNDANWQGHWLDGNGDLAESPHMLPVRSFAPNAFGLYDMVGNAYEHLMYLVDSDLSLPQTAYVSARKTPGYDSGAEECVVSAWKVTCLAPRNPIAGSAGFRTVSGGSSGVSR